MFSSAPICRGKFIIQWYCRTTFNSNIKLALSNNGYTGEKVLICFYLFGGKRWGINILGGGCGEVYTLATKDSALSLCPLSCDLYWLNGTIYLM